MHERFKLRFENESDKGTFPAARGEEYKPAIQVSDLWQQIRFHTPSACGGVLLIVK